MLDTSNDQSSVEARLSTWLEQTLGGKVLEMERQRRWRPAWFVEMATAAGRKSLYVRGARTLSTAVAPFEREYNILRVLEADRIPVPHTYGLCPDPLAIVMDRVAGRPDLSTAKDDVERHAVLDQFIDALAKIHTLDTRKFERLGMEVPLDPRGLALNQFEGFVGRYVEAKKRPDPVMEYLIQWVRRNVPLDRSRLAFVCGDPGQFMFDNRQLTALVDFELSYLGDPIVDIAGLQLRDTAEPLGDLARALRRYAENIGEPIDANAFDFHTIAFSVITPISMVESLSQPMPTGSMLQYLEWYVHFSRFPLELIAARAGLTLPAFVPPQQQPTRYGALAEGLIGAIRALPVADRFATYENESCARLAGFLARVGEYGAAIEREDIAEAEQLLGSKLANWREADAALEAFVLKAGPELDAQLVPLFYRRVQRQVFLLAPFLSRGTVAQRAKTLAELLG
jgi:aminoglycoside phosphotransferase (APT) family kinase protein